MRQSADCLNFFKDNQLILKSSHHNLLGLHVVTIDEAEDINAGGEEVRRQKTGVRMGFPIKEDVPQHVDDLEGAFATDNEISVADEGEGVVCASVAFGEHQLEATGIVVRLGLHAGGEEVELGCIFIKICELEGGCLQINLRAQKYKKIFFNNSPFDFCRIFGNSCTIKNTRHFILRKNAFSW